MRHVKVTNTCPDNTAVVSSKYLFSRIVALIPYSRGLSSNDITISATSKTMSTASV